MRNPQRILVVGCTSAIVQEVLTLYCQSDDQLYLVGRNQQKMDTLRNELQKADIRQIQYESKNLTEFETHESLVNNAYQALQNIDLIIIGHGKLSDEDNCCDYKAIQKDFEVNFLSITSLLSFIIPKMIQAKNGHIVVLSSVAGDRGKKRNLIYSSAKSALSVYLEGLTNKLFEHNIYVTDIKPGITKTPMTSNQKHGLLSSEASTVAKSCVRAIHKKTEVCYAPFYWRIIMTIICAIPHKIYKRLSL